jgi:hypothetical protein
LETSLDCVSASALSRDPNKDHSAKNWPGCCDERRIPIQSLDALERLVEMMEFEFADLACGELWKSHQSARM